MLHDHLPILAFQDPSVLRAGLTRALHEHRFTRSLDPCTVHTCHSHDPFYSAMMRESVQVTCCPSGPSVCISNFRILASLVWCCSGRTLVPSHLLPSTILQGRSVFRPVPLPAFSLVHHPWTAFGPSVPPHLLWETETTCGPDSSETVEEGWDEDPRRRAPRFDTCRHTWTHFETKTNHQWSIGILPACRREKKLRRKETTTQVKKQRHAPDDPCSTPCGAACAERSEEDSGTRTAGGHERISEVADKEKTRHWRSTDKPASGTSRTSTWLRRVIETKL